MRPNGLPTVGEEAGFRIDFDLCPFLLLLRFGRQGEKEAEAATGTEKGKRKSGEEEKRSRVFTQVIGLERKKEGPRRRQKEAERQEKKLC